MEGSSTINLEFNYIEALCTKAGMNYLECLWLSESHFQEAWLGLCSVITRGKNLCSTTKSQKRRANANYFCGISGVNFDSPRIRERIGNGTHATKLLKLAKDMMHTYKLKDEKAVEASAISLLASHGEDVLKDLLK